MKKKCYTCERVAVWDVRLYGYHSSFQLACSYHVSGLMDTKLARRDDYSLEVRRVKQ